MARYIKETSHIYIKPEKPGLAGKPPSPQSITDAIEWSVNYCLSTGETVTIVQEVKIESRAPRPEPSPSPEEVTVDFTTVGSGVPFAHDHFESVGIIFTKSSEFIGFVQSDEALICSQGYVAANIPRGFSDISVSAATAFQGSYVFTLTVFDNNGGVVDQTSLSFEETGSAGYQMLSLSGLSGAVSFELLGIRDEGQGEYGVNVIRFTPSS